jgi:hypothetical protein
VECRERRPLVWLRPMAALGYHTSSNRCSTPIGGMRSDSGDDGPPAAPERHSNPRDPARDTASVRELTASFEKIRLTCDFTVSGEISKVRAMRLLAKP